MIRLSFLALALAVVPGALLFVIVALILKQRRRSRSERIAEEQAKFLPRNPARDEAQQELARAQKRLVKPIGAHVHSDSPAAAGAWGCDVCTNLRARRALELAGTDEPSAPEEGHWTDADVEWMRGASTFWGDPGSTYTASNGTTSTALATNTAGEPSQHPLGWALCYVANQFAPGGRYLCAVPPSGPVVHYYSALNSAWIAAPGGLARAARAALGESS